MSRSNIKFVAVGIFIVLAIGAFVFLYLKIINDRMGDQEIERMNDAVARKKSEAVPQVESETDDRTLLPPPPPPDMKLMKREGCVADALLHGDFTDDDKTIDLVNRSGCYYLHRAIDTWLTTPDWKKIAETKAKLDGRFLYGMFIAEAIDTKSTYYSPEYGRKLDFDEMCRKGSKKNDWGEHTCKPSLDRKEYRKYVRAITRAAMDNDIQVFTFGQVFYQDDANPRKSRMPEVIAEMREYAARRGMTIFVGAQTNDIDDPAYLRLFDFIEGGVGIDEEGNIERGPCHSRWYKKEGDWCWALLWHDRFRKNANNVFVHLDWSGIIGDDMSTFTHLSKERRDYVIEGLHEYFWNRGIGFLEPLIAPLHRDNGGCHGPTRWFYTPDNRFGCQDEDAIRRVFSIEQP